MKNGKLFRYYRELVKQVFPARRESRRGPRIVPIELALDLKDGLVHYIETTRAFLLSLVARVFVLPRSLLMQDCCTSSKTLVIWI